jgi:hypothetical protein
LTIAEVFREDAGNYMVKASNAAGTAKCYAALKVKTTGEKHMVKTRLVESSHSTLRTVQAGHSPPEFTRLFRDTRVRPGEPCTLEVVIIGHPRPTVSVMPDRKFDGLSNENNACEFSVSGRRLLLFRELLDKRK